jgi:hypothetical protein
LEFRKSHFLVKRLFSREKGKEAEKEKGQRARERRLKEGKAWSSETTGLTQVRGVYHR